MDLEAEDALARRLAPAEVGRVLRLGGEQEAGLVAELDRDARRRDRLAHGDAELDGRRFAGEELLPRIAVGAEQPRLGDARLAAAVLAQPGGALLRVTLLGEEPVVPGERLLRRAVELELPVAQQHRTLAEPLDRRGVVRDEDDRAAALLELEDLAEALALELLVTDGEDLVEQEHIGLDVRSDREAEPHVHARRVRADRQVDEALELREGDDLVHQLADLRALEAVGSIR